jgi:beta-lactamase regulating signal transducer with metallopeptidase domain
MSTIEFMFRLVLEATWRMSCIIAVFAFLRFLLRGLLSPRFVYWAWVALAILLIVPLSVPARWSPFNLVRATSFAAVKDTPSQIARVASAKPDDGISREAPTARSFVLPASEPIQKPLVVARVTQSPMRFAAYLWCFGIVALAAMRAWAHRRFAVRLRQSSISENAALAAIAAGVERECGIRGVRIVLTDLVGTPALHGIFRPKLLFPLGLFEKLSISETRLIVLHELCHYKRRDLLSQALVHAAQIVHWFNPIVWLAGRTARNDCELACDEQVMRAIGSTEPQTYGATLLKILGIAGRSPLNPLGIGIVEPKKQMKRRIEMIIANKPSSLGRSWLGCAIVMLVAVLGVTRESQAEAPVPSAPSSSTSAAGTATSKAPEGWWKNGSDTTHYTVGMDPEQMHNGQPSAYVKSNVSEVAGFCGMMQMCSPDKFIGKRVRFSGWMKTENVNDGGAHLWFRVDGKENNTTLQFDNMDGREVKGTTDWQQYSVVLDVPEKSAALAYGFFVSGTGRVWLSGVNIEPVGLDVPSTNTEGKKSRALPEAPVNLGFAQ